MNNQNLLKGIFLILFAGAFGFGSLRYASGSLERAGPGLFPLVISTLLILLGIAIVVRALLSKKVPFTFNVKNIGIILASLCGFAVISEYLNMLVGILFLVFTASAAATSYSVTRNLKIAAGLIAIALVFQKGLGLQLPLY